MPRPATGSIVEKSTSAGDTSYAARFRFRGARRYELLGYSSGGMTRRKAETQLADVMSDIRRGTWTPPEERAPERAPVPTFHAFASSWFEAACLEGGRQGRGLSASGRADLEWRLSCHLLPFFVTGLRDPAIDAITVEDVDHFRRAKVAEAEKRRAAIAAGKPLRDSDGRALRPLSATSINKLLATLSAILDAAAEYGHVPRNVARGKRRRLPAVTPRRTYLDRADHIAALLDAAGQLDRERGTAHYRRPLLAVLVFAGLRIGEAVALRWAHVNLARGTITVPGTKSDAAARTVYLLPALRDELAAYAAACPDRSPRRLVFATGTGKAHDRGNVNQRVLATAAQNASAAMLEASDDPLPAGLTPHSLRRTFASLLYALGEAPPYVMRQMGHTTPHLALAIYAREMDRRDGEPERLRALVEGREMPGADRALNGHQTAGAPGSTRAT
jgi:integrase